MEGETYLLSSLLHFGGDRYEIFDRRSSVLCFKDPGIYTVDVYGFTILMKTSKTRIRKPDCSKLVVICKISRFSLV
jgi:hypothetical protein